MDYSVRGAKVAQLPPDGSVITAKLHVISDAYWVTDARKSCEVSERREFQRLHLTRPADGWFGDFAVRLLDVSAKGGLIEHDDETPAALVGWFVLLERDRGRDHGRDHPRRRRPLRPEFLEKSEVLMDLIAESATQVLRAQEANARGLREENVVSGDETLMAASAGARGLITGFTVWRLGEDGQWKKSSSLLADQPEDGFTVAAGEPAEQVDLLQRNYESVTPRRGE